MVKNEFNIGDKVRLKEFPGMNPYYKGRVCEIASIDNNGYVTFKEGGIHPEVWELELVEPLARRLAFLTRLQSLLREFDARIDCQYHEYAQSDFPCVIFKDGEPLFWLGNDGITADNIMNFDKE